MAWCISSKNKMMSDYNDKEWGSGVYSLLSWFKSEQVKDAKVLVAGAGALGNEVLKNLALFGVGNIFIVDFDTIEYSNLTRSVLFRESDADKGLYKAEVAALKLKEINPNINVQCICGRLNTNVGLGLYRRMDVVIGCLDSRIARLQLNRLCMRAGVPWIDGAIDNLMGNVKVFKYGVSCYECGLTDNAKADIFHRLSCAGVARRNENAGRIPTTPVVASIIGAIEAQEAMKLIHKTELENGQFKSLMGKWFHYDGKFLNTNVYESSVFNDDCPSHELWGDIITIDNLGADTVLSDVFTLIKHHLGVESVEINLRNDRFVDKIITREDEKTFEPMLPESEIPDYIDSKRELYTRLRRDLNQSDYENIDESFPYQDLTLKRIGIPYWDVIQITTERGLYYIELGADKNKYRFQ